MNSNDTRQLLTLLTSCSKQEEKLVEIAQSHLNRSIEQQIIRRLNSYSFSASRTQRRKKKLEGFTYKTDSLVNLFESHKELREMIQGSGIPFLELLIGKYLKFGKYSDKPMIWKIIDVDHLGQLLLLSHSILSFKCFNVADSNYPVGVFTNEWINSTIQQWLNSNKLRMKYSGISPNKSNVWNAINPYSSEKGFLANGNFTESERNSLALYKDKKEFVTLMSLKEAQDCLLSRGYDLEAKPTDRAIKLSNIVLDFISLNQGWCYFLQDSHPDSSHLVYVVNSEGKITEGYSYDGSIGIRPVISLKSDVILEGEGTLANPFEVRF